jgi:ATP-dependent Lon protease
MDRMEIIRALGLHRGREACEIAKQHLIPKQIANHALKAKGEFKVTDEAMTEMIRTYTREAGVRNLEREIAKLARKAVTEIVKTKTKTVDITPDTLEGYLGVRGFRYGLAELPKIRWAWSRVWPGRGGRRAADDRRRATAGQGPDDGDRQPGDVMKESIEAAASYVRSRPRASASSRRCSTRATSTFTCPKARRPRTGPRPVWRW